MNKDVKKIIYILIIFLICVNPAYSQQTVFSVPSADITPKGHVFLEQETQSRWYGEDAFFNGTSISAFGIGHNTDIDVDVYNVSAPASHNITLGTGFKTSVPIPGLNDKFPKREIKFTFGSEVLTSLQGNGVGNWSYAHVSGRLPKLNTRLTAGLSYGTKQVFGSDNLSFISAIEQPINKKLTLITDWYSGQEHYAGFLMTGFSYALPKNQTLYVGYQIPNTPKNGTSGFIIEFSKMF